MSFESSEGPTSVHYGDASQTVSPTLRGLGIYSAKHLSADWRRRPCQTRLLATVGQPWVAAPSRSSCRQKPRKSCWSQFPTRPERSLLPDDPPSWKLGRDLIRYSAIRPQLRLTSTTSHAAARTDGKHGNGGLERRRVRSGCNELPIPVQDG